MPYFANIVIQQKSAGEDYRAFCTFLDDNSEKWEVRGYGSTPGMAADDAYAKYSDPKNWDIHGYAIPQEQ